MPAPFRELSARVRRLLGRGAAEHVDPTPDSPWWGEHRSRYLFARGIVSGERLLDIACGSGYGIEILERASDRFCIGMDLSAEALGAAAARIGADAAVCRSDATRIPLRSSSVDSITCFETLEHVADHTGLVDELGRVLKPGGVALVSTPNSRFTKPVEGIPRNPFHVREFLAEELQVLLDGRFGRVELFVQRPSDRYGLCPFWQPVGWRPTGLRQSIEWLVWSMLHRSRAPFRFWIWDHFRGRSFYPGDGDFAFVEDADFSGHVLLAVCREPRGEGSSQPPQRRDEMPDVSRAR